MLAPAVAFLDLVLALHVLGVVFGFGVTFAYPIFLTTGARLDPRAMPWFFRMMQRLSRQLIYPGLLVVLVCGIYLASKEDQFSAFYVQWGLAAVVVLGGVEGAIMAPRMRTLIELAERDLAAVGAGSGPGARAPAFSAEYQAAFRQLSLGGVAQSLIVVLTIFFMAAHLGA